MRKIRDGEDWKEWTLDVLRDIGEEAKEIDQRNVMLNYIGDTLGSLLGVKSVTFGEDGPTLMTKTKVIKFPTKDKE